MPVHNDALLNDKDAAQYVGLSVHTLRRWRVDPAKAESGPPFIKLGHSVRYRRTGLDDWLDKNTHGGGNAA